MNRLVPNTILMTADTVGGVWTYALELCRVLQEFNVHVHLATMGNRLSNNQRQAADKISNLQIEESDFALEWMDDPWKEVDKAGQWLMDLEHKIQPDLIHLNNYAHGNLSWKAPVLIVGHSCVLSWCQAVKNERAPEKWNTYAERVKKGLQHADYIVAVSHFMKCQLNNYYGPFSHAGVIYNARNASTFFSVDKKPLIFSMGRLWDEAKNISALKKISDQLAWRVYVAGTGAEDQENETITFLDQLSQSEVAEWLSKTSIYVMPAHYEPFGLTILEAALSDCALVLGNTPSLKEIWGDAALYADSNKPAELAQQIQLLIQNPSRRIQMGQKAGLRARCYDTERFAEQYLDVYQKLMSTAFNQPLKKQLGRNINLNIKR